MIKSHVLIEFYRANPEILARDTNLKEAIAKAFVALNKEVKQDSYIQFEPEGVTATVVSDQFHFSIHTWPEFCSCAIDLYSSQDFDYAVNIAEALKAAFEAEEHDLKVINRKSKLEKQD